MNFRELLNNLGAIGDTADVAIGASDDESNIEHTDSTPVMSMAPVKSCGCDSDCDCMTGDMDVDASPDYEEEDTGEIGEIIRLAGMTPAVVVSTGGEF
jgi:hypothetical protein